MSQVDNSPEATQEAEVSQEKVLENVVTTEEAMNAGLERVEDVSVFANLVVAWHVQGCNQAVHVLNHDFFNPDDPQTIEIRVPDETHPEADASGMRPLAPEEIVPFKHGIAYAMEYFGKLPFHYTPTDADGKVQEQYLTDADRNEAEAEQEQQQD